MGMCMLRAPSMLLGALVISSVARAEVELPAEQRENLGIQVEPTREVDAPRSWSATAQVVDVAPLVVALGELHSAESAAAASRAEADRSERLYRDDTNIARKALDAANAQAITDEARVRAARAQLLGVWGYAITSMSSPARTALVDDLLSGKASLVRAEQLLPLPADASVSSARISTLDGRRDWSAQWLGPLPQSNATLAGASLLRVSAPLAVGQLLQASLVEKGSAIRGASVPAAAVIRWRGAEWVYEETSANHFERREVRTGLRVEGRSLLAGDVKMPVNVVIVGARALLGAEQGAAESHDAAGAGD